MRSLAIVLVGVLVLTALAAAGPVVAGHGGGSGMHMGHGEMRLGMILDHLDLTKDQRREVEKIMDREKKADRGAGREMDALHEQLIDLMMADYYDERALRDAADAFARAQADRIVSHAAVMWDVKQVLTPEQIDQLKDFHGMHEGMMKRHGHGFGHGHGRSLHEGDKSDG